MLEQSQHKIDIQAALVGFIDHHHRIPAQQRIGFELHQQDSVGHDFDAGVLVGGIVEAHLVGHIRILVFQLPLDEIGNGEGRNAPWLGDSDHFILSVTGLIEDQGDLGCFTRTGRALHYDDLVVLQGSEDFLPVLVYRQMGHGQHADSIPRTTAITASASRPTRSWRLAVSRSVHRPLSIVCSENVAV